MALKINTPKDMGNLTDGEKKHLPVIHAPDTAREGAPFEVTVRVGELLAHPNESGHYIQWIELYAGDKLLCKATLTPISAEPTVTFGIKLNESKTLRAIESCNLHGLWEGVKEISIE